MSGKLVPIDQTQVLDPSTLYSPADNWRTLDDAQERNRSFWALLSRYRAGIFLLLLLCASIGLAAGLLTPPVYRAEAKIEFHPPGAAGSGADREAGGAAGEVSEQFIETQVGMIRSRALADEVAKLAQVGDKPELLKALGGGDQAAGQPLARAQAPRLLQRSMSVEANAGSHLGTIRVDSRDPRASAVLANAYAEQYIVSSMERQQRSAGALQDILQAQLATAKSRLEGAERRLIGYTRQARLIDPSAGTSSVSGQSAPHSLSSEKLMQMNQSHSASRAERIAAEQRWREAQQTPVMSLPEVLSNPAIQQLTQKSAEAQAALEQERQRRTDQHPSVIQAKANVAEINRQINTIAQSIRNSVRERYEVSRRQEQQLAGTVSRLESETLTDQGKGVRYNVLKREADTNRHVYDRLLERFNEASLAAATPHQAATVLDRAEPPAAAFAPRPAEYAGWGALAGVALSLLYLFGIVILDDGVHSPDELSAKLRVPLLGVLPLVKRPIQALEDAGSPLSEAHYSLRTTLELNCTRAELKTILFTSSTEGEGKSAAAYGMARNFALGGKRVLLVDADMRKPSVHHHFGVSTHLGLSTVLADGCDARSAIIETPLQGLWILPAGPIPQSAAALLSGKQFATMIRQLGDSFDVVVVDGPPVFGLADSPRLAAAATSTILVVEASRAKIANVRAALRRLAEVKAKVIGAVLTKFDVRRASGAGANLYVYGYGKSHAGELTAA